MQKIEVCHIVMRQTFSDHLNERFLTFLTFDGYDAFVSTLPGGRYKTVS